MVMIDVWTYCFRNKKLQNNYAGLNRQLTGFNDVSEDTLAILFVSFVVGIGCLMIEQNHALPTYCSPGLLVSV